MKVYKYKGRDYAVLSTSAVFMKNTVTRTWEEAVIYISLGDEEEVYVRNKEEFETKFKEV